MSVLNPRLYAALELRYRHVGIVNPGLEAHISYQPRYVPGDVQMSVKVTGGEYYRINCPYCNDTRQRLYFSYLWGQRDPRTKQQLLHLATCFNEDCLDSWERRKRLYDALLIGLQRGRRRRFPASTDPANIVKTPSPRKIPLPNGCVPVHELEPDHPAREYLESRDFDVGELWRLWRVRYCIRDPESSPPTYDRIVVPVYRRPGALDQQGTSSVKWQLAGWQARAVVHEAGEIPKYFSAAGMPKSSLLYGLPHALADDGPVAVTEGVTDVWRLGGNAVATFGKSLSARQVNLIVSLFPGRPLVVAYDRDATEASKKACTRLRSARKALGDSAPVSTIQLPPKLKDLGECTRKQARKLVTRAAGG